MNPIQVMVVIPAWDEQEALPGVIKTLQSTASSSAVIKRIVVVDNNSSDNTAQCAIECGAEVVFEGQRGYGAACLRGLEQLNDERAVLFVDADGSDFPEDWPSLVEPIAADRAELVVGSRTRGGDLPGALLIHQKFGNILATSLLALLYKTRFSDLGPFRAISTRALKDLKMQDKDFGWTVEMQIKALRNGISCMEVPVRYRPRVAGKSKVAGSLRGSFFAGKKILSLVFAEFAYHGFTKTVKLICSGSIQGVQVGENIYS